MRSLPVPDPGVPDVRSGTRYLLWLAGRQWRTLTLGIAYGVTWMTCQALMPAVIGAAIDKGITPRDVPALSAWAGLLAALGAGQAVSGVLRHRCAVSNYLQAAYRTVQLTARQATRLGATLPKRVSTGEVVTIGTHDIEQIGGTLDITARGTGSLVAVIVVVTILLTSSLPLGLVVVLGVPAVLLAIGALIRPLHRRQQDYREQAGQLTNRAADIVTGLRVLRGIGGEATFAARYRAQSQHVRRAGVRVGRVASLMNGGEVLLPGLLIAAVTWLGARFALSGRITVGELVAFYGYAAFLISPLRQLTESADRLTRGHVSAGRVVHLLSLNSEIADGTTAGADGAGELVDPESGVLIRPGQFTAVAATQPEEAAAIADRLGRYLDSGDRPDGGAALGGVPLAALRRDRVRELILVATNEDRLFSGRLHEELTGERDTAADQIENALHTASAEEIVAALEIGLDTVIAEQGRDLSGGQQQRLRLARALLADAPVLVLVEPTSAVDAHTEARIGARLRDARVGRTTVVCTTSPLLLDRADHVIFVADGRVAAQGPHRSLLRTEPAYAATVTRGEQA